jgi:hypothetical protein
VSMRFAIIKIHMHAFNKRPMVGRELRKCPLLQGH